MSQPPPELPRDVSLRAAFFSFRGRISRGRYWECSLLVNIAAAIAIYVASVLFFQIAGLVRESAADHDHPPIIFIAVVLALYALVTWVGLALQVKRLHDRGRTGWVVLLNAVPILGPLLLAIDTYLLPGKPGSNRYGPPPGPCVRSTGAEVGLMLAGMGIFLALVIIGRTFVMEPFNIPSGSGEPTIVSGDYIAVSRYTYRLHQPERGDIAVFVNPHTGEDYIKRIVGLPGDTVQLSHGILSINGQAVQRRRIADYHERTWLDIYRRYDDTLRYRYSESIPGGQPHEILGGDVTLPEDSLPQDNTPMFRVPPDRFFAIGDNRDNSSDSRFTLGYVPLANLVGRAEFCLFSRAPSVPLWRVMVDFLAGVRWERVLRVIV
jgi:signal peptidase I